jgi:hypothetical protein
LEYKNLFIQYYKGLINSCFKLIPIYNGEEYKTRKIIYLPDIAYNNYQIYLGNLIVEIYGNSQLFFCSETSIKLIGILRGMIQEIQINEQEKVKRLTRECINLCKKIIQEIERLE